MTTETLTDADAAQVGDAFGVDVSQLDGTEVRTPAPLALVIFGASGDLARGRSLPALAAARRAPLAAERVLQSSGCQQASCTDEEFQTACRHERRRA